MGKDRRKEKEETDEALGKEKDKFGKKGNGKISFEEFRGILYGPELAVASRKTRYAKYAVLFKQLDTDGSRSISKEEFIAWWNGESNDKDGLWKKLHGEVNVTPAWEG